MKKVEYRLLEELEKHVTEAELFRKIFEDNQLSTALTNAEGVLIFYNKPFFENLIEIDKPINTREILKSYFNAFKESDKIHIHFFNGSVKIPMCIYRTGRDFLWIISKSERSFYYGRLGMIKNLYRSFIENSFEMIFQTSSEGKIVFANKLFAESFEWKNARHVRGRDIVEFFENQNDYRSVELELQRERKISSLIISFRKKSNTQLTGLVNAHMNLDQFGKRIITWTVLDISQQVESERDLKNKNDQLAKVNHQMERFLYSTSHDLRAPITTILGLINLVRLESRDSISLSYISKIEASTLKLDKIIRDFLSFSRTTYKHNTSERIDFDVLIWKVINNHRDEKLGRRIHFELRETGGFPFYGDTDRIEIVIDNIVRNAIQFHDANKSKPFVQINIFTDESKVSLDFIDNGIGIGKEFLPDIFNMFYKASHTSHGAGLGLYIVKETVEKLEGQVAVESEIGFGTLFHVEIPNDKKARLIAKKLQLVNK